MADNLDKGNQQDRPGRSTGGAALGMRTTEHEVAVYDASLSECGADPYLPMATG